MMNVHHNLLTTIPLLAILLLAQSTFTLGCVIHGTDSGVCTREYLPASSELSAIEEAKTKWMADMPFCGRFVASYYSPCVPSKPTKEWTTADANFPHGRIATSSSSNVESNVNVDVHSIRAKDAWVEQSVSSTIQGRIESEKEQGTRHYFRNKDCQEAYSRYMCWLNFPRCSDEFDQSLPMCQSGKCLSLMNYNNT